jgi:ABC-type branched-subunit amino acid transport system substrate-binding protein
MTSTRDGARTPTRRLRVVVATGLVAALVACGAGADDADDDAAPLPVRGVDGDTVTVGAITVSSGPMAAAGASVTAGNRAYFAALDDRGGLAGRYRVDVAVVDGADDAATIAERYESTRDDVVLYVQVLGFRAAGAALEPLMADDVLAATYALDFPWSRHQNLVAVGTPVTVGINNALDHHVQEQGARSSVCALVDRGDYGDAAHAAVRASAALLSLDLGPVVEVAPAADDVPPPVAAAVDEVASAGCDVVVAATFPGETTDALAHARSIGFAPEWFVPEPGAPVLADPALAGYATEHVRIVADGARWDRSGASHVDAGAGLRDLVAARDAHAPEIGDGDPWFLQGYLQAMAVHQVLETAIDRGDLSRSGILLAANDTARLDLAGMAEPYAFGTPERRDPPRTTVLVRPGAPDDDVTVTPDHDLPPPQPTPFEQEMQQLTP